MAALRLSVLVAVLGSAAALPAKFEGRRLFVTENNTQRSLHLKGVNWNPVGRGGVHPHGLEYRASVETDARLMQEAGINALRTYECLTDRVILDVLWSRGIQVINTVWANGADPMHTIRSKVEAVKDHPAILMWAIGNEWNYNGCYAKMSHDACLDKIGEVARLVSVHDSAHPISTIYGELPSAETIARLPEIQAWGINYYDMDSFSDLFDRWAARSSLPMYLGEYGADAYNALEGRIDEAAHAHATRRLTTEIMERSAVRDGGICLGGLVFELTDEWWKDGTGSPHSQDVGGLAPGGGPYPDRVFNEEWWGLLDIHRVPREAYRVYASLPVPIQAAPLVSESFSMPDMRLSCTMGGCTSVPKQHSASIATPAAASTEKADKEPAIATGSGTGGKRLLRL